MRASGVILAGGKSTRMGCNKAVLEIGGRPLIDRLVHGLQGIFPEVVIVANTPGLYDHLGVPVVPDLIPDKGSLGGIYTATATARHPWAFVMACDMPFFNPVLIRYLTTLIEGWDAVVPYTDDWEPLYALYAKTCLPQMERLIHSGDLKIARFFPHVRVRQVGREELKPYDPHERSLFNMNTPEELARAEEWWRQLTATG
ncbi:MAG TPA: molybdenum cofactor guanylyltransferase [Candidatus Methylomirabilis sp.]|nr:molybdenum cofactor guanylyltransferase [Candidatus Methylomirabilis sp.]